MQVLQVDRYNPSRIHSGCFFLMWNCTQAAHLTKIIQRWIISIYPKNITGLIMPYAFLVKKKKKHWSVLPCFKLEVCTCLHSLFSNVGYNPPRQHANWNAAESPEYISSVKLLLSALLLERWDLLLNGKQKQCLRTDNEHYVTQCNLTISKHIFSRWFCHLSGIKYGGETLCTGVTGSR